MRSFISILFLGILIFVAPHDLARADGASGGGAHTEVIPSPGDGLTAKQRMDRRFPQKVRVGDLIDLPLQDYDDRIIGHVSEVTRDPDGSIGLVVSHCDWWIWDCRLVRVPIETVVILARHLNLMDIPRAAFLQLATWSNTQAMKIAADDTILIGIGRR